MKKHIKLLLLVVVALVTVALLVSCGGGSETSESKSESSSESTSESTGNSESTSESTEGSESASESESTEESTEESKGEGDQCLVRFLGVNDEVLKEQWVNYGGNALAPRVIDPEGYKWTKKWDREFKNVTSDIEVRAIFDKLELFKVSFVDANGNEVKSYDVYETKGLKEADLPGNPGKIAGKVFMGWGLSVDGAEPTQVCKNEYKTVNGNQVYKAMYKAADATAPYVTETIKVDGVMDEAYQKYSKNGDTYTNVFNLFYDPEYTTSEDDPNTYKHSSFWSIEGELQYTTNTADGFVVWDGDWVYVMIEVSDKTLGGRSSAYINGTANAYLNDTIELWYNFDQDLTGVSSRQKVGIDAMGIRRFGTPENQKSTDLGQRSMSWWFGYVKYATSILLKDGRWVSVSYNAAGQWETAEKEIITKEMLGDKYRVEFGIPAKTEPLKGDVDALGSIPTIEEAIEEGIVSDFKNLEAGDVLHMCMQCNDLQYYFEENAKGEPQGIPEGKTLSNYFTANGRTQYYYPVYDLISLGAKPE